MSVQPNLPPRANTVALELRLAVEDFYAAYIETINDGDINAWPDFFIEDCTYKLIPRENYDRNLPLATIWCESKGMLKDRIYAWTKTLTYIPRHYRHILSNLRIHEAEGEHVKVRANYLIVQSTTDDLAKVASAGKYVDTLVRKEGQLKFAEKLSIFDSMLIPNSVVYPV